MALPKDQLRDQLRDAVWSPDGKYAKYVDASIDRLLELLTQYGLSERLDELTQEQFSSNPSYRLKRMAELEVELNQKKEQL